ncbi:hypothetical protein ACYSNR_10465 [Enterococcus sp. LJL128]
MKQKTEILLGLTILFGFITTLAGIFSFDFSDSYEVLNQYGEPVELWGFGIYAHDSYFKAPILIGSDWSVLLFLLLPMSWFLLKYKKSGSEKLLLLLTGLLSALLYYAVSLAIGVAYNRLHLIYILFFSLCFFSFISCLFLLDHKWLKQQQERSLNSRFVHFFLILSGFSLFIAWLPDILSALISDSPLAMLEIYTTEITYVIDLAILSPFIFLVLYLVKTDDSRAYTLLPVTALMCTFIGIMVIFQTVMQLLAAVDVPLPALVTKVIVFILLSFYSSSISFRYFKHFKQVSDARDPAKP